MPERLYQLRFDGQFQPSPGHEVTPSGFDASFFNKRKRLGRFIAETTDYVQVTSPAAAAQYLQDNIYTPFDEFDQEEMWVLLLNAKNRITHSAMVYRGTVSQALIRTAEVLKPAVRVNASTLILSHCHPSGDPTPSPEDMETTKHLYSAAALLGIEILDHIIVGKDRWVSLKERGLPFYK